MERDEKNILDRAVEMRDLLKDNDITIAEASHNLKELISERDILLTEKKITGGKYTPLKSLFVVYNRANFADATLLVNASEENYEIIDYAGDDNLLSSIYDLIDQDRFFYRDLGKIDINGRSYQLLYESMNTDGGTYSVITLSESALMRGSSFHILCDIVMDLIKMESYSPEPIHYDFLETLSVGINSYLSKIESTDEIIASVFSFSHINHFFKKMGFSLILEISSDIENKLSSIFGANAGIFQVSLSMFLVITGVESQKHAMLEKCRGSKIDFSTRGIVLPYACIDIDCERETSSYTILQKILK